jgi:hypothetical protein
MNENEGSAGATVPTTTVRARERHGIGSGSKQTEEKTQPGDEWVGVVVIRSFPLLVILAVLPRARRSSRLVGVQR